MACLFIIKVGLIPAPVHIHWSCLSNLSLLAYLRVCYVLLGLFVYINNISVCNVLILNLLNLRLFSDKYILRGEETDAVLHKLVDNGKKLFLITNSPFAFV